MTEDKRVGWHHQLNGHEPEQPPGDGEGTGKPGELQSMWSESDMTERLNNNRLLACDFLSVKVMKVKTDSAPG